MAWSCSWLPPSLGLSPSSASVRPVEAGEQAIAVRLDLDELGILSAEYSRVASVVAWSTLAGAAADELIPPRDLALAVGGGTAWLGLHRVLCPAGNLWTSEQHALRRTRVRLGVGLGRRLGGSKSVSL